MTNLEQFCNNAVFCLNSSLGSWFSPKKVPREMFTEIIFFEVFVPRVSNNEKYHFMLNYLVNCVYTFQMIQVNAMLVEYCILENTLIFFTQFYIVLGQFRVKKPP